jgi:hypothetical protein
MHVPSAGHNVSVSIGIPCSQRSVRDLRLMDSYPLARRSWVLQERLLSPRILHCGADDIVFECNSAMYAGSFVHALPPTETWGSTTASTLLTKSALQYEESDLLLDSWYTALMSYRSLELTHESDRLPAIAGIAKVVTSKLKTSYLAGLMECDLAHALAWQRLPSGNVTYTQRRPSSGPSWS